MGDLFGEPGVAGNYCDTKEFGLGRLDEEKNGLLVAAGGSGGVLVDDDFAFWLGGGGGDEQEEDADSFCFHRVRVWVTDSG